MQRRRHTSRPRILSCASLRNQTRAKNGEIAVNSCHTLRPRRQGRRNNCQIHRCKNMTTIKQVFQKQKQQGNGCLIGYITAGDPSPERTPEIATALIRGGVDILELGLPFSDPIADGPTIQAASLRALKAGTTPMRVVEIAKEIKTIHDIPIVIMT